MPFTCFRAIESLAYRAATVRESVIVGLTDLEKKATPTLSTTSTHSESMFLASACYPIIEKSVGQRFIVSGRV